MEIAFIYDEQHYSSTGHVQRAPRWVKRVYKKWKVLTAETNISCPVYIQVGVSASGLEPTSRSGETQLSQVIDQQGSACIRSSRGLLEIEFLTPNLWSRFYPPENPILNVNFTPHYDCVVASAFWHALSHIVFFGAERFHVINLLFPCISPPNAFWPGISQLN